MKKHLLTAALVCVCLSCCAAAPNSPAQGAETTPLTPLEPAITYEVGEELYEKVVTADDGTVLHEISYSLPHLEAYAGTEQIVVPATAAQEVAVERVETFNERFALWTDPVAMEKSEADVRKTYRDIPDLFTGEQSMPFSDTLTHTVYRTGGLISIAGTFYTYSGGAHPNTTYLGWNFDLDSGAFLAVPELSQDPPAFTLAVADMIEAQARERFADPDGAFAGMALEEVYFEDYRSTMEHWDNGNAVDFDATGLNITFSPYSLAPYAYGPQFFHFTYEELDGFWSDSGRALLGLSAPAP